MVSCLPLKEFQKTIFPTNNFTLLKNFLTKTLLSVKKYTKLQTASILCMPIILKNYQIAFTKAKIGKYPGLCSLGKCLKFFNVSRIQGLCIEISDHKILGLIRQKNLCLCISIQQNIQTLLNIRFLFVVFLATFVHKFLRIVR